MPREPRACHGMDGTQKCRVGPGGLGRKAKAAKAWREEREKEKEGQIEGGEGPPAIATAAIAGGRAGGLESVHACHFPASNSFLFYSLLLPPTPTSTTTSSSPLLSLSTAARVGLHVRPFRSPPARWMRPGWPRARPSLRRHHHNHQQRRRRSAATPASAAAAGELSSWRGRGPHY